MMEKNQIREKLRKGEPVEIRPNVYARVNRENKTLEYSDGKKVALDEKLEQELIPSSASDLRRLEDKEKIRYQAENIPFGKALFQAGETSSILGFAKDAAERYLNQPVKSLTPKAGQEGLGYFERLGENYLANRQANVESSQEIQESNPYQSMTGKGLGMAADLALTKNLSATQAAPLLALGSHKTGIIDNPKAAFEDAAIATALGYGTDKAVNALGKVASSRSNRRSLRNSIADLEEQNVVGQQRVSDLNQQQQLAHRGNVSRINAQNETANQLFDAQTQQRNQLLQALPSQQSAVNQSFKQNVMNNLQRVERSLGNASIDNSLISVNSFIDDVVNSSVRAGSKEAKEASNFLSTVFKGTDGKLTPSQMIKGFEAVEDKIASSTGELRNILREFKSYSSNVLPEKLPNAIAYSKYAPKIQNGVSRTIQREVVDAFESLPMSNVIKNQLGSRYVHDLERSINNQLQAGLSSHSTDFIQAASSGELKESIFQAIRSDPKLLELEKLVNSNKSVAYSNPFFDQFADRIASNVEKQTHKYLPDINLDTFNKRNSLQSSLQGIQGEPRVLTPPPAIAPPTMQAVPSAPTPNTFVPTPIPSMPAAQGLTERLGESLENYNPADLLKSKGTFNNPIAKLAGLKYLFGKAAAPIEAAVIGGPLALKGLTSPSAGGQLARDAVRQGGALGSARSNSPNPQDMLNNLGTKVRTLPDNVPQVIQNLKMKYPSYHDGIFDTPEDRKSAVAEIEKNPYLSLDDKATLQANINRGKPIE